MTVGANKTEDSVSADTAERPLSPVRVVVVNPAAAERASYSMFELLNLSERGAFLQGPLFFEVDEEFSLQLSQGDDPPILARVRVVRLERGAVSGMEVAFADLSDAERAAVTDMVARWGD